eukprot:ctg_2735.g582
MTPWAPRGLSGRGNEGSRLEVGCCGRVEMTPTGHVHLPRGSFHASTFVQAVPCSVGVRPRLHPASGLALSLLGF